MENEVPKFVRDTLNKRAYRLFTPHQIMQQPAKASLVLLAKYTYQGIE